MSEETSQNNTQTLFISLVGMFHSSAMQALGKVMNPVTQKIERDLTQAQMFIDMLGMLQEKTAGNLTDDEARLLNHMLFELRMNYVDEVKKDETEKAKAEAPAEAAKETGGETAAAEEMAEKPSTTSTSSEKPSEEPSPDIKAEEKVETKSKSKKKSTRTKASTKKKTGKSKK